MPIEWNKVTWYSKLFAVILGLVIFYVGFKLGEQKKQLNTTPAPVTTQTQPAKDNTVSITSKVTTEENFKSTIPVIVGTRKVAEDAREYITQTVDDFRKIANSDVPDLRKEFGADSPTSSYEIFISAKYLPGDKIESIVLTIYVYTGGAHGNSAYAVFNRRKSDEKILTLADIIKSDKQAAFTTFVKQALVAWRPDISDNNPVVFEDSVKDLTFDYFENWSIDDANLTLYFNQYDIGPGSLGEVAFPIPVAKLKDFLK